MSLVAPPKTLPAGTILGGKFRVIRAIGAGGMGAVYEVHHEVTKHRRALKLLHGDVLENKEIVQRFLREASVAGTLGDPHIVETFDGGELPSGEPYLVMELLEGEPLSARIARGCLPIAEAASIGVQLCDAMEIAHARGIVHRDLKPDNVFLCTRKAPDGAPFVKVLDFGISKFAPALTGTSEAAQTLEGTALGTPYYMPPEQVDGAKDVDARSDVYAIGVILYESLTARRPFQADSMPRLMVLIHEGKFTPPKTLRAAIPDALDALVVHAMARDRGARIATANELRDRLLPFATGDFSAEPAADLGLAATQLAPEGALATTALASVESPSLARAPVRAPSSSRVARAALVVAALLGIGAVAVLGWQQKEVAPSTTSPPVSASSISVSATPPAAGPPSSSASSSASASTQTSPPTPIASATPSSMSPKPTSKPPPNVPSGFASNPL